MSSPDSTDPTGSSATREDSHGLTRRRLMLGGAAAAVTAALVGRTDAADAGTPQQFFLNTPQTSNDETALFSVTPKPALFIENLSGGSALGLARATGSPESAGISLFVDVDATHGVLAVTPTATITGAPHPAAVGTYAVGGGPIVPLLPIGVFPLVGQAIPRGDGTSSIGALGLTLPNLDTALATTVTAGVVGLTDTASTGGIFANGPLPAVDLGPGGITGLSPLGSSSVAGRFLLGDPAGSPVVVTATAAMVVFSEGADPGVVVESHGIGGQFFGRGAFPAIEATGDTALMLNGALCLERSGRLKMTKATGTVSVPGGITSETLGFAIPQNNVPGIFVQSVKPSIATGKFTITLNQTPPAGSPLTVAWFAIY